MSFDFRLMFVYHGCMMMLMLAGSALPVSLEAVFVLLLVAVLVGLSLRHRRALHWRWPGIKLSNLFSVLWTVALISFFLYAATPLFPPNQPQALPWYLAGLGIGTFGVLSALRIVYSSETEFLAQCRILDQYGREVERQAEPQPPVPVEVVWKRRVRVVYGAVFVLLWITGVASFYFFGTAYRDGSPVPTMTKTEPLVEGGKTVYVSRTEKQRINTLQVAAEVGFPVVILSGLALHFLLGIRIFGDTTSFGGLRSSQG